MYCLFIEQFQYSPCYELSPIRSVLCPCKMVTRWRPKLNIAHGRSNETHNEQSCFILMSGYANVFSAIFYKSSGSSRRGHALPHGLAAA